MMPSEKGFVLQRFVLVALMTNLLMSIERPHKFDYVFKTLFYSRYDVIHSGSFLFFPLILQFFPCYYSSRR